MMIYAVLFRIFNRMMISAMLSKIYNRMMVYVKKTMTSMMWLCLKIYFFIFFGHISLSGEGVQGDKQIGDQENLLRL